MQENKKVRSGKRTSKANIKKNAGGDADKMRMAITLNELMLEKGLDRTRLAEKADISLSTLNSWASGSNYPGSRTVMLVAKALGVDCHYLLTGTMAKDADKGYELGLSQKSLENLAWMADLCAANGRNTVNDFLGSDAVIDYAYAIFNAVTELNNLTNIINYAKREPDTKGTIRDELIIRRDALLYKMMLLGEETRQAASKALGLQEAIDSANEVLKEHAAEITGNQA